MHELSIVMSIVDSVEDAVRREEALTVKRIILDIGNMSGIEMDSFDFAWESAIKNSVLEHAERVINHIPAMATCIECQTEFEKNEVYDPCPKCGNFLHTLKTGKEMKIKSLLIA